MFQKYIVTAAQPCESAERAAAPHTLTTATLTRARMAPRGYARLTTALASACRLPCRSPRCSVGAGRAPRANPTPLHPPIHAATFLLMQPATHPSTCLSLFPPVCSSLSLPTCPSTHPSVHHPSTLRSVHPPTHLSIISPSVHPHSRCDHTTFTHEL